MKLMMTMIIDKHLDEMRILQHSTAFYSILQYSTVFYISHHGFILTKMNAKICTEYYT